MESENKESGLRHQKMVHYSLPLREGGSLPLLGHADDGFDYVIKLRGAGHGCKALVAELIGGEVARRLGLKVPELILVDVDENFGRTESDPEIQDLLRQSRGTNLGMHFLRGAMTMDPWANPVTPRQASEIVWLDAFLTNIDRTPRNTNMLVWHGESWLIDHGASLFFHHAMSDHLKAAASPFPYIREHSLIHKASELQAVNEDFKKRLTPEMFREIVDMIPDRWLEDPNTSYTPAQMREVYVEFLTQRLQNADVFTQNAIKEYENRRS